MSEIPESGEILLDAACVARGTRLLDVAVAAGQVAALAAQRGASVITVDFPLESLPFDDNFFDAVVCGCGAPDSSSAERLFREAFRVLRSGGRFAFTTREGQAKARIRDALAEAGFTGCLASSGDYARMPRPAVLAHGLKP